MITVCAWCQKYMGSKEPLHDHAVSHGICGDCLARDPLEETPVLVVSPRRAGAVPMLQSLLRGTPEISIVVDRRSSGRRDDEGKGADGKPARDAADRRTTDRRRTPSFYLI